MWAAKRMVLAALLTVLVLLAGCVAAEITQTGDIYRPQAQTGQTANYKTLVLEPTDVNKVTDLGMDPVYDTFVDLKAGEALVYQEYLVTRGQSVAAGEPVVRLSRNASQADVEEARLALMRAQEAYDKNLAAYEAAASAAQSRRDVSSQARELYVQLAQLDLEEYEYTAQKQLQALEAALETAQAQLEDVYYYAPFDAVVGNVNNYSQGAKLDMGSALMTLYKADSVVLTATSNTDFFQYGMEVTVEYGKVNSRKTASGRVIATDRVLGDYLPNTAAVYIALDDRSLTADDLEKPTAYVTTPQLKQVLVVPKSAMESENGEFYVNVLEGGTVLKRYILKGITGGTVGSYQVQVLAGLEFGQTIVLD